MIEAIYIAESGMQAQQKSINTISNNITNMNTNGFKKASVSFSDMVVAQHGLPVTDSAQGPLATTPHVGSGVSIGAINQVMTEGTINHTGSAWDVAINGAGFLEVVVPDGSHAYSRGGTLKVNENGKLATVDGYELKPGIAVDTSIASLGIAADGKVSIQRQGQDNATVVGQLQLVRFTDASQLTALGNGLYSANAQSGEPIDVKSGDDSAISLQQGSLEGSNVSMVDEMVNLMVAQRAYEASTRLAQASDEINTMINNLRK